MASMESSRLAFGQGDLKRLDLSQPLQLATATGSSSQVHFYGQVSKENKALEGHNHVSKAAVDASKFLFQPGVLEALSGAVAARLAEAGDDSTKYTADFQFSAGEKNVQTKTKKKGREDKKRGTTGKFENARKVVLGKKKGCCRDARPMGSDVQFSFENSLDSYERMLYTDVIVSSKRVCTGRVEVVQDVEGVMKHVAKETEGKEEAEDQQGAEPFGEQKDENGTSVASAEEVCRAK